MRTPEKTTSGSLAQVTWRCPANSSLDLFPVTSYSFLVLRKGIDDSSSARSIHQERIGSIVMRPILKSIRKWDVISDQRICPNKKRRLHNV
jgi:hypothetical protein